MPMQVSKKSSCVLDVKAAKTFRSKDITVHDVS